MNLFRFPDPVFSKIAKHVCKGPVPSKWIQPFTFKTHSYSLFQKEDGPCGLLASLQAYICISLRVNPNVSPDDLLIEAILDIMYKIRRNFVLASKIDLENHYIEFYSTQNRKTAHDFLKNSKWYLSENASLLFVYSIVILLGPVWLDSYAFSDLFIINGQTSLNFVLLLLTGDVLDSFHDGNIITNGVVFKGALSEQEIGFVSISDSQAYQNIGNYFSHPLQSVWIGYYGGHFTTIVKTDNNMFLEFDSLQHNTFFNDVSESHIFYQQLTGK
ncbi:hypothetical protein TRFO_26609 [Tritrichomonas foetus]|uniref:Deubiquitinating enzyme MINDY-3/4 conserved domain-containing protein n=1 Tax=Tritrichomonas foetus TaxID=1144522 RepID=A0A1J4K433_9EUKA|nr:hypothetical protein TRFO_26609 [Tritrichomonas foetus]|eukprot:OHT05600.1 hypothetical protein TRFO_26609 [Tritrichomonas foetus]